MKLLSVNVSQPIEVEHEGRQVRTGIFKKPTVGPCHLGSLNLAGDGQADLANHGGPDKAAYAYAVEHYAYWGRELHRDDLVHGQFGENLTVEQMLEGEVHIGDKFRVGGATVQVSQPRVPCFKLGIRMGSQSFVKQFLASRRVGFYLRVLQEGNVEAGNTIQLIESGQGRMTVDEICHLLYFDKNNVEGATRAVGLPELSQAWRESFARRLQQLGRAP